MALLVSDRPAALAGVFTTNKVTAAPVKLCKERLAGGTAQAVAINSGSANCCTGEPVERSNTRLVNTISSATGEL